MKNRIPCAWLIAFGLAYSIGVAAADWRPERNVEVVVGTAPGSSSDRNARRLQKIWQDYRLIPVPQVIVNRPGGGGEIGWNYLAQHAGDAHYVSMVSPTMLSNQLMGKSRFTLADVTPLALLMREYETFSVKTDHNIKSMADLAERLKKDPASVSFGFGIALGNAQHVTGALYGRALGLDVRKMKMVVFNASAEALTSVVGGHVDVLITTLPIIEQQVRAGKLRALAAASPNRFGGILADVPTFKDTGLDIVFSNWNGVVGVKNMTSSQVAFWNGVFSKTTSNAEWKKVVADLQQDGTYLASQEMKRFLEHEREQYRGVLAELGLIN